MRGSDMKTLIYCRCSTDQQTESEGGVSIQVQAQRCTEYAALRGWDVTDTIIDEGLSGGTVDRPGFSTLLDRIESNGIEVVLIYSIERLSRDMLIMLLLERFVTECGITLATVEGMIDTSTPDGFMAFGMKIFFGEIERRQVKHRTKNALRYKRENGFRTGGIPYGYREVVTQTADKTVRTLIVEESEQNIIGTVNEMYRNGSRLVEIVSHLNNTVETRTGKAWIASQVKRLITDYEGSFKKSVKPKTGAIRTCIETLGRP
jgi:site-specific DNA recombinase